MKTALKYSYSTDEEHYHGSFDTPEEAAHEGFASNEDRDTIHVGENHPPKPPEDLLDVEEIIEQVQQHDDYAGEWAESWPEDTKEQRAELGAALRKTFAEWLDKHNLRPTFFRVKPIREVSRATVIP